MKMKKKILLTRVATFLLAVAVVPVASGRCTTWFGEPKLPARYEK